MKLIKLSLIAAVLVGSSAFAISNVKVAGNAKLYYSTNTNVTGQSEGIFGANNSYGQAAFDLGLTADLTKGISAGASMTALSSLGLQQQLVANTWDQAGAGTTDSYIVNTAWIAGTYGKTTAKIGRMKLDTPLIFTQNWSIVENTFEAAVLINQNIPNTTLVGAYVGGSNGNATYNQNSQTGGAGLAAQIQGTNNNSTFSQFYNGAYAVGVINNSIKPLKVQAWFYDAPQYVQDWWLQADVNMMGITLGAQYTGISYNLNAIAPSLNASNAGYAVKLGYKINNIATITGAISQISKSNNGFGAGDNLAEFGTTKNQSKLYTEAWWNYGYVTRANTTAENITITSPVNGLFDLGLYWTHAAQSGYTHNVLNGNNNGQMNEFTVTAKKAFGPLNTTLAYVYTQAGDQNSNVGFSTVQARLTYNF